VQTSFMDGPLHHICYEFLEFLELQFPLVRN